MSTNNTLLSMQVADKIRDMILNQNMFSPGTRLPSELELCRDLNISRTTLREAIRTLVAQGLLQTERGKGTYVCPTKDLAMDLNGLSEQIIKLDIKDLYDLRLIFEPQAAYYAALRASDREISKIWEYAIAIEHFIEEKDERRYEYEYKFHYAIAVAAHNPFIEALNPFFSQSGNDEREFLGDNRSFARDIIVDHRYIMDFIKRHHPEGARTAMRMHIINTMKALNIPVD